MSTAALADTDIFQVLISNLRKHIRTALGETTVNCTVLVVIATTYPFSYSRVYVAALSLRIHPLPLFDFDRARWAEVAGLR